METISRQKGPLYLELVPALGERYAVSPGTATISYAHCPTAPARR